MTTELNLDYTLTPEDQDSNRVGKTLGLQAVYDVNLTVDYTYKSGEPRTLYDPAWGAEYDIASYYVAGVYEGSTYVTISKAQSDVLLSLKPSIIDDAKLLQCVIDTHTDNYDPF